MLIYLNEPFSLSLIYYSFNNYGVGIIELSATTKFFTPYTSPLELTTPPSLSGAILIVPCWWEVSNIFSFLKTLSIIVENTDINFLKIMAIGHNYGCIPIDQYFIQDLLENHLSMLHILRILINNNIWFYFMVSLFFFVEIW